MKLKDITKKNDIKTSIKDISISDDGTILNYTPMFTKDSKVKTKVVAHKISRDLERLDNLILTVEDCKLADLGDMLVEVVYFKKDNPNIQNPYLVEYFSITMEVQSVRHINTSSL